MQQLLHESDFREGGRRDQTALAEGRSTKNEARRHPQPRSCFLPVAITTLAKEYQNFLANGGDRSTSRVCSRHYYFFIERSVRSREGKKIIGGFWDDDEVEEAARKEKGYYYYCCCCCSLPTFPS